MEIDNSDLANITKLLEQMADTVQWKIGTDPLADFMQPKLDRCLTILESYLDPEHEKTTSDFMRENTQMSLFDEEGEV